MLMSRKLATGLIISGTGILLTGMFMSFSSLLRYQNPYMDWEWITFVPPLIVLVPGMIIAEKISDIIGLTERGRKFRHEKWQKEFEEFTRKGERYIFYTGNPQVTFFEYKYKKQDFEIKKDVKLE